MPLSESQKKHLRRLGHKLKPTIMVGDAGVSDAVLAEFETTIAHHELLKAKVRVGDRSQRDAVIAELCRRGKAELVQRIGNVALLYRENPDQPRIRLPAG